MANKHQTGTTWYAWELLRFLRTNPRYTLVANTQPDNTVLTDENISHLHKYVLIYYATFGDAIFFNKIPFNQ